MGRNAKISIMNNTDCDWVLDESKTKLTHGKFNQSPTKKILKGTIGVFKVGNRTGAKIGPKGSLVYVMQNKDKTPIKISWNHPFSATTSTYQCVSDPIGVVNSSVDVTGGHDQKVDILVVQKVEAI